MATAPSTPKTTVASDANANSGNRRRSPALPVAAAFALGSFADHRFESDLRIWLAASAGLLALWLVAVWRGFRAAEAPLLLAAVAVAGAGWHHWRWSIVAADHVVRFSQETPQ